MTPEQKLSALLAYFRGDLPVQHICKKYDVSRENLRQWKQLLYRRADLIFEHGSTLAATNRLKDTLAKRDREIAELREIVADLRAQLDPPTDGS